MQTNDRISMFQEVATCQYQMTITTPRLCEEMMLASTSHSDVNKIECNPIVPDHLVEDTTTTPMDETMTTTTSDSSSSSAVSGKDFSQATTTTTTTTTDTATTTMTWQDPSTSNPEQEESKPLDMSKESLLDAVAELKAQLQELRQQVQQQRHDRSATTLSQLEHLLRGVTGGAGGGDGVVAGDDGDIEFLVYQVDENGELVAAEGGGLDQLFTGQQEEENKDEEEEGSQRQNKRAYEMRYL